MAWIRSTGELAAIHAFVGKYDPFTIHDAVALSASQFVTVRNGVTNGPNGGDFVMDWLHMTQSPGKDFWKGLRETVMNKLTILLGRRYEKTAARYGCSVFVFGKRSLHV